MKHRRADKVTRGSRQAWRPWCSCPQGSCSSRRPCACSWAPGRPGPIGGQYSGHVICLDQSELTLSPFLLSRSSGLLFMKFSPLSCITCSSLTLVIHHKSASCECDLWELTWSPPPPCLCPQQWWSWCRMTSPMLTDACPSWSSWRLIWSCRKMLLISVCHLILGSFQKITSLFCLWKSRTSSSSSSLSESTSSSLAA